jgi:hypothetical protein
MNKNIYILGETAFLKDKIYVDAQANPITGTVG